MNCAELREQLLDFLYGELDADAGALLEAHTATCASCRAELSGLQNTLRATRSALQGPLSEDPPARVRRELRNAARQQLASGAGARHLPWKRAWWHWLTRPWLLPVLAGATALAFAISHKLAPHPEWVQAPAREPPARIAQTEQDDEMAGEQDDETADEREGLAKQVPAPAQPSTKPNPLPMSSEPESYADSPRKMRSAERVRPSPVAARRKRAQRALADPSGASEVEARALDEASGNALDDDVLSGAEPTAARTSPLAGDALRNAARVSREEKPAAQRPAALAARPAAPAAAPAAAPVAAPAEVGNAAASTALAARIEHADRAFREKRWSTAAAAYRRLLRDYPAHRAVVSWKQRLRSAEAALR